MSPKNTNDLCRGKLVASLFEKFQKPIDSSGRQAIFLTDVRLLVQCTQSKPLVQFFSINCQKFKNCNFSRTHWAKDFCSFPYQPLNYQEIKFEQSFLKDSHSFWLFVTLHKKIALWFPYCGWPAQRKSSWMKTWTFGRTSYLRFFFRLEQKHFVLEFSICILCVQENSFRGRFFEEFLKKSWFFEWWSKNNFAGLLKNSASAFNRPILAEKHETGLFFTFD